MDLFDNGEPEEFLLFIQNYQITLDELGTLATGTNIQYLCILLHGEAIHQLETLSVEVGSLTIEHLNRIILGFGTYLFPVNVLSKKKRAMHRIMRDPGKLKVRRYYDCIIDLDE